VNATAAAYLVKAEEALAAAADNVARHPDTAINRAYYAMFYAAKALLAENGRDTKTHRGTISQFAECVRRYPVLPAPLSRWLADAAELREIADYGLKARPSGKAPTVQLERASEFVRQITKSIEPTGI
jgi:uncharacterized protein